MDGKAGRVLPNIYLIFILTVMVDQDKYRNRRPWKWFLMVVNECERFLTGCGLGL
jgi:hypothetical protein